MPVEIKSQEYEFEPTPSMASNSEPEEDTATVTETVVLRAFKRPAPKSRVRPPAAPVVRPKTTPKYNPIHDLEGFWWTTLMVTVYRKIQGTDNSSQAFRHFMQLIFQDFAARGKVMTKPGHFKGRVEGICPDLAFVSKSMEAARILLVKAYTAAETNITTIDHTAADGIYSAFQKVYTDILAELEKTGDIELEPLRASFVKPQEELVPALNGLSLDSRKEQLGKRSRDVPSAEYYSGDVFDWQAASATAKRAKLEDPRAAPEDALAAEAISEGENEGQTADEDAQAGRATPSDEFEEVTEKPEDDQ